jgi:PAS domain S-box-containing protein
MVYAMRADAIDEIIRAEKDPIPMLPLFAAAQRENFYRTVLESLAEAVMITDGERRIVYANRLVTDITGYAPEELIGQNVLQVLAPDNHKNRSECTEKPPLSPTATCADIEMKQKDGRLHWVHLRTTPYRNERGEIAGSITAFSSIERQKNLEWENEVLQADARRSFGNIVGQSPALQKVMTQIATVAPTNANVLILGESGTGKELVARAIHDLSSRKDRPLIRVNCASIPKELFESEFFGHVRGAFTGAVKDRTGRFELADGGTLLLDEIGEIPLELQSKLLRVVQEGQFERLGEERTRTVDVRVIAATNRDLPAEARAGRFRLDLYYRLSVFPIELPSLRERSGDVATLAEHFVQKSARRLGVPHPRLTKLNAQQLEGYDWPGNVRELQNVIERAVILARGGRLQFDLPLRRGLEQTGHVPSKQSVTAEDEDLSLDELVVRESQIVLSALHRRNWKIYGANGAAALLNVKPTTLVSMIKRLGLVRPTDS